MNDATEYDHDRAGESPTNRLFDALADERRRLVLDAVNESTPPVPVEGLARRVASRERGGDEVGRTGRNPSADAVHRVHVSLHHVHLPKLDEAGLVEYDANRQVVRRAADPPDLPGL